MTTTKVSLMVSITVLEQIQGRTEHYRMKKRKLTSYWLLPEAELSSQVVSGSEMGEPVWGVR